MLKGARAALVGGIAFLLGVGTTFAWDTFGPQGGLLGLGASDQSGQVLLAINADGSAVYALYPHTSDPYRGGDRPAGERPGIVVQTQQGVRTTLLEAADTPGVSWTVAGDLDAGNVAVRLGTIGLGADTAQYLAGPVTGPLAEIPSPTVDGRGLETAERSLYLAGSRLVAPTATGDALAMIDTTTGESQLIATDIGQITQVHRDLCAAPGDDTFAIGTVTDGESAQWAVSVTTDEEPRMTQVDFPVSMQSGASVTSCGAAYAAAVRPSSDAPPEATLFQAGQVWAIGAPGLRGIDEILLGPDYAFVGATQSPVAGGGAALVRRSDRSSVWLPDARCGPWLMRGEWIAYVEDTGTGCKAVVTRAADVT